MMELPAQLIANLVNNGSSGIARVLDIAAGHGVFGIKLADPPNAEIVAVTGLCVEVAKRDRAKSAADTKPFPAALSG
jgi:tRNA1(Val) A37 N6-methylase TrmN6